MNYLSFIFLSISGLASVTAFQIWMYRYAYQQGYDVGKHCGFTNGLYQGKLRENHRLTEQANKSKMTTSWAKSNSSKRMSTV